MGGKSSTSVNYGQGSSDLPRPMYAEPTQNNSAYRPQSLADYERSVAPDNLGYGQYWDRGPASNFQGQVMQAAQAKGYAGQQPNQPYQPYQPPQNTAQQPAPFEQLPTAAAPPAQATIQGVQYGQLPGMASAAQEAPSQGIGRINRSSSEFDDWSRS